MNRDEKPEESFARTDPVESKMGGPLPSDKHAEDFAAWLVLELEKLEAQYQGFSTGNSRRSFFGR